MDTKEPTVTPNIKNISLTEQAVPPKPNGPTPLLIVTGIFVVLLFCIALFFEKITNVSWLQNMAYTAIKKNNPNILTPPNPTPSPSPTPSFLPSGKQTYSISGPSYGPKISSLTLNPLDAHKGNKQSLAITAASGVQLVSVVITIFSDTKKTLLPLSQIGNEWTTTWVLNDSVNSRYVIRIDAIDTSTSSSTLIAPRTNGPIHLDELNKP